MWKEKPRPVSPNTSWGGGQAKLAPLAGSPVEGQLGPVGWEHSALPRPVYIKSLLRTETGIPEIGRPEEGRNFPVWSWVFPGIYDPSDGHTEDSYLD